MFPVRELKTIGEWIFVLVIVAGMFTMAWWLLASGPPEVDTPEPTPAEETLLQLEDLNRRMETLESDMQEILHQLERIMGASEAELTAYCTCPICTAPYSDGYTATGVRAVAGDGSRENPHLVAVDPRVIPLGSQLYIEGLGHAKAVDVGRAIRGNRIDVLMPSHRAALKFGRKTGRVVWYVASRS